MLTILRVLQARSLRGTGLLGHLVSSTLSLTFIPLGAARKVLCPVLDLVLAMIPMLLVLVGHLTTATLVAMPAMATLAQRPCGVALPHETILLLAHGTPTSGTEEADRPTVSS